jgi:hypothetical protein
LVECCVSSRSNLSLSRVETNIFKSDLDGRLPIFELSSWSLLTTKNFVSCFSQPCTSAGEADMSRNINANVRESNVVAILRDFAVDGGSVARDLHLHLTTALGKGAASTSGFYSLRLMSHCWQEVSVMWTGRLALIPITINHIKRPHSSKRWS